MIKVFFYSLLLGLVSCGGGGGSISSDPNDFPGFVELSDLTGYRSIEIDGVEVYRGFLTKSLYLDAGSNSYSGVVSSTFSTANTFTLVSIFGLAGLTNQTHLVSQFSFDVKFDSLTNSLATTQSNGSVVQINLDPLATKAITPSDFFSTSWTLVENASTASLVVDATGEFTLTSGLAMGGLTCVFTGSFPQSAVNSVSADSTMTCSDGGFSTPFTETSTLIWRINADNSEIIIASPASSARRTDVIFAFQ